jgi:HD-GYP domain-containing protein (c-di-GMP phosphodiesterase class II)
VADAYASLTDARPFRDAYSEQQARQHLIEWTGIEFDPRVVRVLLALEPFNELKGYAQDFSQPDFNLIADEIMARLEQLDSL